MDEQIRTLIENGVKTGHRSMFVIVGDKNRDQVVNLYNMLTKAFLKLSPAVLWCYKHKPDNNSHKKKHHRKQIEEDIRRETMDPVKADMFSLFESVDITYCPYSRLEKILGTTFGMCILQDFEAFTPIILASTINTVEGGGVVLLLLQSLSSLTRLYTMVMDVHERFRIGSNSFATAHFNERFVLSLASCKACAVMDDEMNLLPISSHIRTIVPMQATEDSAQLSKEESYLRSLKEPPIGPLLAKCCTLDQGHALMNCMDAILDKRLRSTVALLGGCGCGKSAALGLAVAGAIAAGYSNIYVSAPTPNNVKILFEFVCKGFNALDYKEHLNYDVEKSDNPEFKDAIVRINIFKQHKQTIKFWHEI